MAFTQAFLEWEQKTEERGWIQGSEEGRRSLLFLQLSQRFAPLPKALVEAIQALTLDQLDALAIALFDFTDQTALETWLTQALAHQLLAAFTDRLGPIPAPLQQQLQTASLAQLLRLTQTTEPIADVDSLAHRLTEA